LDTLKLIFETMSISVKIVNTSSNPLPQYATEGSAGLDLRASIETNIELQPLERRLVPTGLFIELPAGYEAQVRPRSGLAVKQGLTCLNSPGTVDSDYRGEIKILLINLSGETQIIQHGDRIAQMVVQKVEKIFLQQVEILSQTSRSEGGFGSTGKN
jgi:dUTP pyrophosphatase